MSAFKAVAAKGVNELRFALCQTGSASAGVRCARRRGANALSSTAAPCPPLFSHLLPAQRVHHDELQGAEGCQPDAARAHPGVRGGGGAAHRSLRCAPARRARRVPSSMPAHACARAELGREEVVSLNGLTSAGVAKQLEALLAKAK